MLNILEISRPILSFFKLFSYSLKYFAICCILQVNSEEHDLKPIDLSTIPEVNKHNPEVEEAIVSDQSIAFKDITVWIDPLDATKEYTGNHIYTHTAQQINIQLNKETHAILKIKQF